MSTDVSVISAKIGAKLRKRHWKLAVAESLTGGLLADCIVQTPGASKYFQGGIVSYANKAKRKLLNVSWDLLLTKGAVDKDVAYQMAAGACYQFDTDCGVSTTGFAGADATVDTPDGEQNGKSDGEQNNSQISENVGLVYICVITPDKRVVKEFNFDPKLGRKGIRNAAVFEALTLLDACIP